MNLEVMQRGVEGGQAGTPSRTKSGLNEAISAKIQPADQTSIDVE